MQWGRRRVVGAMKGVQDRRKALDRGRWSEWVTADRVECDEAWCKQFSLCLLCIALPCCLPVGVPQRRWLPAQRSLFATGAGVVHLLLSARSLTSHVLKKGTTIESCMVLETHAAFAEVAVVAWFSIERSWERSY